MEIQQRDMFEYAKEDDFFSETPVVFEIPETELHEDDPTELDQLKLFRKRIKTTTDAVIVHINRHFSAHPDDPYPDQKNSFIQSTLGEIVKKYLQPKEGAVEYLIKRIHKLPKEKKPTHTFAAGRHSPSSIRVFLEAMRDGNADYEIGSIYLDDRKLERWAVQADDPVSEAMHLFDKSIFTQTLLSYLLAKRTHYDQMRNIFPNLGHQKQIRENTTFDRLVVPPSIPESSYLTDLFAIERALHPDNVRDAFLEGLRINIFDHQEFMPDHFLPLSSFEANGIRYRALRGIREQTRANQLLGNEQVHEKVADKIHRELPNTALKIEGILRWLYDNESEHGFSSFGEADRIIAQPNIVGNIDLGGPMIYDELGRIYEESMSLHEELAAVCDQVAMGLRQNPQELYEIVKLQHGYGMHLGLQSPYTPDLIIAKALEDNPVSHEISVFNFQEHLRYHNAEARNAELVLQAILLSLFRSKHFKTDQKGSFISGYINPFLMEKAQLAHIKIYTVDPKTGEQVLNFDSNESLTVEQWEDSPIQLGLLRLAMAAETIVHRKKSLKALKQKFTEA